MDEKKENLYNEADAAAHKFMNTKDELLFAASRGAGIEEFDKLTKDLIESKADLEKLSTEIGEPEEE